MWSPNNDWQYRHDVFEPHNIHSLLNSLSPASDFHIQSPNDQYQYPHNYFHNIPTDLTNYGTENRGVNPGLQASFQNVTIATSQQVISAEATSAYRNQSKNTSRDGYSPFERLTDTISTLKDMPSKIERTSINIAEKFNRTINDVSTLSSVVEILFEACLTDMKFLPIAGKFCHYLCRNVKLHYDGVTLCSLLFQHLLQIQSTHEHMIQTNPEKFRMVLMFSTDLFVKFEQEVIVTDQSSESYLLRFNGIEVKSFLATLLYTLYKSALTIVINDDTIGTVIDMLLLSGRLLEQKNESTGRLSGQLDMDSLMLEVDNLSQEDNLKCSERVKVSLSELISIRNNNWVVEEAKKPRIFDFESSTRKERPNAIKIINPNDSGLVSTAGDFKSTETVYNAEELEFTDAELQFMSDEIEANELAALLKDDELRMPVEIEEAYEEFLNEQQAVLPVVPLNES